MELRAVADCVGLPAWLCKLALQDVADVGGGRHVLILPGFAAGDRAMWPMRYFFRRHGFVAETWGLGTNWAGLDKPHDPAGLGWSFSSPPPGWEETGVAYLVSAMKERVQRHVEQHNTKVALVGWSMGGTIAREVARDLPGLVDHVVTLGSPVIGGPKYTRAASSLRRRGLDLDWIEAEVRKRSEIPLKVPVTALVSKTDGIVDWSACIQPDDPESHYVIVNEAHLGMGFSRSVMEIIVSELG